MAAIITNKFRINNAEQFVESFSETAAETYYLFIGRAHAWASDADVQGNKSQKEQMLHHQRLMMAFLMSSMLGTIC